VPSVGSPMAFDGQTPRRTISSVAVNGAVVTLTLSGAPWRKDAQLCLDPCAAPHSISGNSGGTANYPARAGKSTADTGEASRPICKIMPLGGRRSASIWFSFGIVLIVNLCASGENGLPSRSPGQNKVWMITDRIRPPP
jgi:hypothetical protein